jgi:hypothetical protein
MVKKSIWSLIIFTILMSMVFVACAPQVPQAEQPVVEQPAAEQPAVAEEPAQFNCPLK